MEHTTNPVEEKIIGAAIACIEKFGIKGATNRQIAKMAGVNSAAINYYFRSKEALIARCMQVTLGNAFDWQDVDKMPGDTAKIRCKAVFDHIIEGACNYPGITRAHFFDLLTEEKYDSPAVLRLNQFLLELSEDLHARGGGENSAELHLALVQIAASALMIGLTPALFVQAFGLDLRDAGIRQAFVDRLVERLL